MTARASIWVAGMVGSVLAHGGLLIFLTLAVDPEPVTNQPLPTSELEVQAYQLDRVSAQEQKPDTQQADTTKPESTALDAGAIPKSQAHATKAPTEIVPIAATKAKQLYAKPNPAPALPEVVPVLPKLTAKDQPKPRIAPAQMVPTKLAQLTTPAIAPLLAVLKTESTLPQIAPVAAVAPQIANPNLPAPAQHIAAAYTAPTPANTQKLKAALAFSGADGDVDPVSIAAFQSFMQPGDVSVDEDQLRDGVAGLLAQVPCSRLQVGFDPETATLQVNGHVPDRDMRAPVLAALRAQMGADIAVADNMLILPRPQCGALAGIAGVGLPQSTDQNTNPLVIGKDTHAKVFNFTQGDLWSLDMTAPDYDAYIYLDYFDANGNVLHVEPNDRAPLRHANAESVLRNIGGETKHGTGLKLVIGPPYGQEIAVAFAASELLYDGLRPIQEPAAEYLEWLKSRVDHARARNPDFKGEWIYFFVSTAAR